MNFTDLSTEELMNINGGYSWEEFKKDVGDTLASWGEYLAWCAQNGLTPTR